jgi:hypothetical protein
MADYKPDLPASSNGDRLKQAAFMDRLMKPALVNPIAPERFKFTSAISLVRRKFPLRSYIFVLYAAFPSVI